MITERSNLDVDPAPGETQRNVLEKVGPTFVETGDVKSQTQVDDAAASLLDDSLVKKADPSRHQGILMTAPRQPRRTGNSVYATATTA